MKAKSVIEFIKKESIRGTPCLIGIDQQKEKVLFFTVCEGLKILVISFMRCCLSFSSDLEP